MMRWRTEGTRLTHIPTGITAESRDCAPRNGKWKFYHHWSRALLLARLCRPIEEPRPVRSYHLHPPLGIEPYVKQGDRVIATGDEVQAMLRGEREFPA